MIFKVGVGSEGRGDERYTIRVPFALSPGSTIAPDKPDTSVHLDGREAKIESDVHSYALRVGPFRTREEATAFFPKAVLGLLWLSVKSRIGVDVSKVLAAVKLQEPPTPIAEKSNLRSVAEGAGWDAVDGHYDSDKPVVIPEHKRLMVWEMGRGTVTASRSASSVLHAIAEALASRSFEDLLRNTKLQLALEVYAGSFFEAGANSRFLQLVTVLGTLIRRKEAPETTKEAVQELLDTLKRRQQPLSSGSAEHQALEKLRSRVGALRKQTIAESLRDVARSAVAATPILGTQNEVAEKIEKYYAMRSNMLHEGVFDPGEVSSANAWLADFVPNFLRGLFFGEIPMPA